MLPNLPERATYRQLARYPARCGPAAGSDCVGIDGVGRADARRFGTAIAYTAAAILSIAVLRRSGNSWRAIFKSGFRVRLCGGPPW